MRRRERIETFTKGIKTTQDNFDQFIDLLQRVNTYDTTELKTPEKEPERIQNIGPEGNILDLTVDALRERVNMIDIWHGQVRCSLKSLKSKQLQCHLQRLNIFQKEAIIPSSPRPNGRRGYSQFQFKPELEKPDQNCCKKLRKSVSGFLVAIMQPFGDLEFSGLLPSFQIFGRSLIGFCRSNNIFIYKLKVGFTIIID